MYTEHINKYYAEIEGQLELRKNLLLAFDSFNCHSSLVSGYVYGTFMGQLIIS